MNFEIFPLRKFPAVQYIKDVLHVSVVFTQMNNKTFIFFRVYIYILKLDFIYTKEFLYDRYPKCGIHPDEYVIRFCCS